MKTVLERMKSLLSRKFLVTAVSNIVSIILLTGADSDMVKIVGCGGVVLVDGVYIIMEALIDKSHKATIDTVAKDLVDTISKDVTDIEDTKPNGNETIKEVAEGVVNNNNQLIISAIEKAALKALKELLEDPTAVSAALWSRQETVATTAPTEGTTKQE